MKSTSTLLFIFLISCLASLRLSAQVPNGGFENWVLDINGDLNPVDWTTTNSSPDVSVSQYTPAYSGNYSMKVEAFDPGFGVFAGLATIDFPYSQQPDQLTACLMANVMPGDFVYIILALHNADSVVAAPLYCTFKVDSNITQFTCMTFPITYQSTLAPDSATIIIAAGNYGSAQMGTYVIIDDLSFGFSSGIEEAGTSSSILGQNYPNPASNSTTFPLRLSRPGDVIITVYDAQGKEVKQIVSEKMPAGEQHIELSLGELPSGVYSCSVRGEDFLLTRALLVNR